MGYYCGECKKETTPEVVDFGIGSYECHGYRGVDTRLALASDCCEGEVFHDEACTVEADEGDFMYDQACQQADHAYDCWKDDQLDQR